MPHAIQMPSPGFQALILCGPGVSLNTFCSNPEEFPKALVPIANRPMVWYALDWCYRMGITSIHLITPPEAAPALQTALSQNPHLTSLPLPKPTVLSPPSLGLTTGTASLLRIPEIASTITSDFLVLPCDLITTISPTSLLETWLIHCSGLGGATGGSASQPGPKMALGGEKTGRRGGLGVWYPTKDVEGAIKKEETDFVATTPLPPPTSTPPSGSLRPHLAKIVTSMPTDTFNDKIELSHTYPVRRSLPKHGRVKYLHTYRDAHIYFLPHWVLEFVQRNPEFENISEDVIGWWAKATWQNDKLAQKLHLREILETKTTPDKYETYSEPIAEDEIDLASLSTTHPTTTTTGTTTTEAASPIPPILGYLPPPPSTPPSTTTHEPLSEIPQLLHRVDSTPLLLSLSLTLAKLPPSSHPLSHPSKLTTPSTIHPHTTITTTDVLLDSNVIVSEHCIIKSSVVGSSSSLLASSRLTRCLLMEAVEVGERATLTGCILGRRCRIGKGSRLTECEVQEGYVVPDGTEAKGEKFMASEFLQEEGDGGVGSGGEGEGLDLSADYD
ncbi:MAG: hypothetical protein M1834_000177 [Cirrosporium novae-zelandiae]|nr:MAG: hypothetical protein M1834_000177 [Cirrosporium novae-zelandiae]